MTTSFARNTLGPACGVLVVLVHHRRPIMGSTSATATQHAYTPHDPELPLTLQDHSHPVRYRNIWMRRLAGYDQPGVK